MQYKIEVYDFEVTKDWWLCGFMDTEGNYHCFQSGQELDLMDYITKHKRDTIFVGYNSFHFDRWCLKCIFYEVNPWKVVDQTIIKQLPPHLISELQYKKNIDFQTFDLMRVLGPSAPSLKDIEANMGVEVKFDQSIMKGKDEHLTKEEKQLTIEYNKHDCWATLCLYNKLKPELDTYLVLIDKLHLPMSTLNKKKSQIFEVIGDGKFRTKLTPYEFKYKAPSFIKDGGDIQKQMESFSFTYDNPFEIDVDWDGYTYKFGRGGAHYAIKNFTQEFDDDHVLVMNDFSSFYPGMMANPTNPELRYINAIIDWKEFRNIIDLRLDAKKKGDKIFADALKVPINSAYGKLIDKTFKYSYWPAGLSICLTGQLITWMICEALKRNKLGKLVQVNTDGFYYMLKSSEIDRFNSIMDELEKQIGIEFERHTIKKGKIIQKDVNNYVIYDADSKEYKVKGALVRKFNTDRTYMYYGNSIVDDAIVNNLIHNVPVTTTMFEAYQNNCANKFQLIYNMKGRNYEGCYLAWTKDDIINKSEPIQKINRGFATADKNAPSIRKLKGGTFAKFPDMPEHVLVFNDEIEKLDIRKINLDIQWYINLANKGIKAFLGKE